MASRTLNIIDELYGRELRPRRRRPGPLRRFLNLFRRKQRRKLDAQTLAIVRVRRRLISARRIVVVAGLVLVAAHAFAAIYYFNALTRMEQDVFREQAKVASLLQRRRNVSINLARTVRDYAVHEAEIFRHLAEVRAATQGLDAKAKARLGGMAGQLQSLLGPGGAGAVGAALGGVGDPAAAATPRSAEIGTAPAAAAGEPGPPLAGSAERAQVIDELDSFIEGAASGEQTIDGQLAGLLAVAERYPDLKLSDNFRSFMDALVVTEKELCDERMKYSDVINSYTTKLMTFPGNIFALAYGFEPVPYFEADQEALQFTPVDY